LAAVCRAPQVIAKKGQVNVRLKTEVEKLPDLIGVGDRVAAKDSVLQNTRKRPVRAGIGRESPASLPEIRCYTVELPPGDRHLAQIRWINGNGALVCGVTQDVVAICIDVYLKARKRAELRDHSRRGLYLSRRRRRIIVRFKWHIPRHPRGGRQLA
jgi:hypothetical protein